MLMTGIPAAVAFCATGVSASPSLGRMTSASGLLLISVSIWSAWPAESVALSLTVRSTPFMPFAMFLASLETAASQP